ncbi:spermidine/putrescine ABC transporter substrate-binding protein PotF [Oleiphilus sp. HI0071]|uniref:polyamine ABC transporter substrate-binding protein n=1 Tax=unclassified Oleiphilus TaxID=2631174 RepID=UPI0007C24A9B|nr:MULTISPECIES: polyamine ABC transporter substrate-binding protein [unclassified Oleiphilus]KZY68092.1 spermidine/putrescine ABC transporter substrate-binding protein PotF [Oleiphilus sp. HI0065]KZY78423.1 spermidine/putrescine ABC transporter substrate-binding protein PotF [Oleiphilus sp. HI0071]KZZ01400.1 spermidine/putrescine ABC transporter substrate-binding protein PotF [Oleiphilus sp. HI0073]KZZ39966.1 spermidine/putrescine ABC transporter substrate-binding protein PotF [Oleiphilus sp. 
MKTIKNIVLASTCAMASAGVLADKTLNVYNWSDYIAEDTLANFEAETGIKVTYDVFDSNDVLEAKLLSGKTGYDVVVPSATFMARQIQAGVFQELDMSKLPNHKNLDAAMMEKLSALDPNNAHSVPYLWGTTGIGINVGKVAERLGEDMPTDTWDLVFKPELAAKLADCGITILDAWDELVPTALNYLGEDPKSTDTKLLNGKVKDLLDGVRPHVRYFHSSQYINDLANGDVCLSVGWSGDILQAVDRAAEAENGVEVAYIIPKEGAGLWFDMLAIPKDAANSDNAHAFLDFLMRKDVIAGVSNYVWYPNAVPSSKELIDEEITSDPAIYPTPEVEKNLFTFPVYGPKFDRAGSRMWTALKSGK